MIEAKRFDQKRSCPGGDTHICAVDFGHRRRVHRTARPQICPL